MSKLAPIQRSHAFCTKKEEKRPGGFFSDQNSFAYYKLQDTELLSQFNAFSLNRQNCWEVLLNTTCWENDTPTTQNHAVDSLTLVCTE